MLPWNDGKRRDTHVLWLNKCPFNVSVTGRDLWTEIRTSWVLGGNHIAEIYLLNMLLVHIAVHLSMLFLFLWILWFALQRNKFPWIVQKRDGNCPCRSCVAELHDCVGDLLLLQFADPLYSLPHPLLSIQYRLSVCSRVTTKTGIEQEIWNSLPIAALSLLVT